MLAKALCAPGRAGRQQLDNFIGGAKLASQEGLLLHAALFRFMRITERWVEARHALTKKLITGSGTPNAGAVHLCFHLSLSPLRSLLDTSPGKLYEFAEACRNAANIRTQLQRVGLWSPLVLVILGSRS